MKKRVLSWGTCMCDIIAPELEQIAEPGVIEYLTKGIELRLGGHPVDLVIDLARIGVDPSEIGVVSTVGTDVFGDFLLQEIAPYGFQTFIERVEGGTGKTMILSVEGQDRLCHLDPAACMKMSPGYFEDALKQTTPDFFTFRPGYTNLDTQMAAMLEKLRGGPLKDSFLLLDLCAPYQKPWSYYLELLPHVDAVHGNGKEIVRAAGEDSFQKATEKMLSLGVDVVLLTKEDGGAEMITDRRRIAQPSFNIRFVEPSGCGDAFCGGVIYALMQSEKNIKVMDSDELSNVLMWGQALGASAATQVGCVEGVTKENVQRLIGEQGDKILHETKIKQE